MIELGVDDRVHVENSLSQTERDLGYQCSESEVAMLYTAITELKTELANSTAESVMSNELKIELAKSKAETDKLKQDLKAANQTVLDLQVLAKKGGSERRLLSLNKKAYCSSVEHEQFGPANAFDQDGDTRWASAFGEEQQ